MDNVEQSLLDKDFDAILLTKITGSENRESFVKSISRWDDHQSRFNDDYLEHQGIYYDDNYYEKFTVYHAETTLYCICEGKERAMIWRGIIEITEPDNIEKAIKDYVNIGYHSYGRSGFGLYFPNRINTNILEQRTKYPAYPFL